MADDVMEHYWLQVIAGKLDRLIELSENVERASRSQEMPEEWCEHEGHHFVGAGKMVAEGPSTEAVRSDSLGDGYRIPSEGDIGKVVEVRHAMGESWVQRKLVKVLSDSVPGCAALRHCQFLCSLDQSQTMATCWRWARIKIEEPAKEEPAEEPPKKWRILHPGESVRASDWENEDLNSETDPPDGPGWRPASMWKTGRSVLRDDKFIYARLVADEPAKEPEHSAGPMPDPGEGCCEPTEKDIGGDIEVIATASWIHGGRSPAEPPAKEPKPAWDPKVGDWVRVTRPQNWKEGRFPYWPEKLNEYDGQVCQIDFYSRECFQICGFVELVGFQYKFHRDWLSPTEPPASEKPAEPEYRQPVLPADAGKECQFSDDGSEWHSGWLDGCVQRSHQWISHSGGHWRHCRIKKDA